MFRARLILCFAMLMFLTPAYADQAPRRVVSMNLCTDQLAYMIAAPGQLVSVTYIASDPSASLIHDKLSNLHINHGLAEEILRLDPDLVIAGAYTTRTTVHLLRRLGVQVEEFKPSRNFQDIRNRIVKMGELLHREKVANNYLEAFDKNLEAFLKTPSDNAQKPVLGIYSLNSYVAGKGSLESEMTKAAGFRHMGAEIGLSGSGRLSLESLILTNPDQLMTWRRWAMLPNRSADVLRHPALQRWFSEERRIFMDQRHWICGTPEVINGIKALKRAYEGKKND
ncbi:MAG: ABC transporter substrate-binding protein [Sneathiellales bacterium]|nr:ABC transporter substrate-binding protein [Sneathiellales bacterium]